MVFIWVDKLHILVLATKTDLMCFFFHRCFLSYQYKRFQGEHKHAHILQIELQQVSCANLHSSSICTSSEHHQNVSVCVGTHSHTYTKILSMIIFDIQESVNCKTDLHTV